MRDIGIDCLSTFGLPPVQLIELCANLGGDFVSLGAPVACNPEAYTDFKLVDAVYRKKVKSALLDNGIRLAMGDGFYITPFSDARSYGPHLDTMAYLGAETINMITINMDLPRSIEQFAILAQMAADRGMSSMIEFCPGLAVCDLLTALEVVRQLGRADLKLVIDFMHVIRSGATPQDIARLEPGLIGYAQLCDCTLVPVDQDYEAVFERMCPGDGELPIRELLAALPATVPIGLEIPQRRLAEAGVGPRERLQPCVLAVRALLSQ